MKFESKISGTKVTEFGKIDMIFDSEFITMADVMKNVTNQDVANWILDELRFTIGEKCWFATIDWDTIIKLSIWQNHPDKLAELKAYFGENWMNHYIRFNH